MKILALGDVVGSVGCAALEKALPKLKHDKNIDFCIVNGENSADGNGIHKKSADWLFSIGADVITTGNHVYRRFEFYQCFDEYEFVIRPANFPKGAPGNGMCIYDMGSTRIAVINLLGVVYLEPLDNPFFKLDEMIEQAKAQNCKIIIVDFHAEATAEKKAIGYYADGRVSVLFGTHTHTQTNDLQIFENGTGYITDLGMCGPENSVLGMKPEISIEKIKTHLPVRFETADGECIINGAVFEVDEASGSCISTELISFTV